MFHHISINCHYGGGTTTIDCGTITTYYCSGTTTTFFSISYSSIPWRLTDKCLFLVTRIVIPVPISVIFATPPDLSTRLSSFEIIGFTFSPIIVTPDFSYMFKSINLSYTTIKLSNFLYLRSDLPEDHSQVLLFLIPPM